MYVFNFFILVKKFSSAKIILVLILLTSSFSFPQKSTIDSLENVLKNANTDSVKINAELDLITLYASVDSTMYEKYLAQLLNDLNNENLKLPYTLYYKIGKFFEYSKNDFYTAIKFYELASSSAKEENNLQLYLEYNGWLGYTILKAGDFQRATEILLYSISFAETNEIINKLPRLYVLTAFAYRDISDYEKAEHYFKKTIEISNKIGDSSDIHTSLHEIGNLFSLRGDYKTANDYHLKALEIRKRQNLENLLVFSYNDISYNYIQLDSLDKAMQFANLAENCALKLNNKWILFHVYINKLIINKKLNKVAEAEKILRKMREIAGELRTKPVYSDLYFHHYDFYKSINRFQDALKYHELYLAYKDSLSNDEIKKNIYNLDKKYESAQKDLEILKSQEFIKRQRIIIITIIIFLIVVFIFLLIFYKQYRQIKKVNQQLEKQKQEIQKYAEELNYLNKTKDKLFSIIAHDLRSPFTVIQGFSNVLIKDLPNLSPEEAKNYLQCIYQSSVNTLELLDKLLLWAKKQSGQINFKPENIKLKPIIIDTVEFLKSAANFKNIQINYSVPDELYITADREMLKTILRNLIHNSIKYTKNNGKVNITADKKESSTIIKIEDNGIGMNETTQKNLFEIDSKKTVPGTEGEKGSGLGLLICYEFIKAHNGTISFESELGKGTTFILSFPDQKN